MSCLHYCKIQSFALVSPEVGEEMVFESSSHLASLKDSGRLDLHSVSNVVQSDLFSLVFERARGLKNHPDGGACEGLWLLALSNLQTRQVVRRDLAGIDDVRR